MAYRVLGLSAAVELLSSYFTTQPATTTIARTGARLPDLARAVGNDIAGTPAFAGGPSV